MNAGPRPQSDAAGEIAKLKEQNEHLVKQVAALTKAIEELQKTINK